MRTAAVLTLMLAISGPAFSDERDEAKRHFVEAEKQFQLEHYAEAAKEYEAGYQLFPRPGFLWDIAQSYRKLGNNEKALHFYKQYVLNAAPGTKAAVNVPEAQEQIKVLEPLVSAQQKAKSAPPDGVVGSVSERDPAAPAEAKPQSTPLPKPNARTIAEPQPSLPSFASQRAPHDWYRTPSAVTGFSLLGLAIVATGVGVGLVLQGNNLDGQLTLAMSIQQADSIASARDRYRYGGYAMFALAGASAAVGAILVGIKATRARGRQISFALMPGCGGGILLGLGGSL